MKAAKLSANTVSTTILTILIMKLILLLVHFSRVCEFEILVLRLNILSRVEFNSEVESEVKFIFKRLVFWGRIFCKFTSFSEVNLTSDLTLKLAEREFIDWSSILAVNFAHPPVFVISEKLRSVLV